MEKNLSITNEWATSKVASFSTPLLIIGATYILAFTLLPKSVTLFLYSIIIISLNLIVTVICLIQNNNANLEDVIEVDSKTKNYSNILETLEKQEYTLSGLFLKSREENDYITIFGLERINTKCELTKEESLKQIKKINDVHLADVFKTLDIAKGDKMSYDKEKNVLYMTIEDFKRLQQFPPVLESMVTTVVEGLIDQENLNKQFLKEAIHEICFDLYIKNI